MATAYSPDFLVFFLYIFKVTILNPRLVGIQPEITPLFFDQFIMGAAFDNLAVFDYQYLVGLPDRA